MVCAGRCAFQGGANQLHLEETLNRLLEAEAHELCNARKYERNAGRASTRAGHYTRNLHTTSRHVKLNVPKLRNTPFETAIIKRYRRREISVDESLAQMHLAGVSVRRVEDITEAFLGLPRQSINHKRPEAKDLFLHSFI